MRYVLFSLSAFLILAGTSSGQELESHLPCAYGIENGDLRGFRANEYCAERDNYDIVAVSRYIERLDDSFWERAWLAAHFDRRGYQFDEPPEHLVPFTEVDISHGVDDWAREERIELESRTEELMAHLRTSYGFIEDPDLNAFLQRELNSVVPNPMVPSRPGAFQVLVLKSPQANAYALSTGTIVLTTGLLTSFENRNDLEAVLAHEVAHILLDHHIAALRSAERRPVWGAVIGAVASAVAREVAWQTAGRLGASIGTQFWVAAGADVAARIFTAEVIEAIGLRFSRGQEEAADRLAQLWIMEHDRPPGALISAIEKSSLDTLIAGSHPPLGARRSSLSDMSERIYDRPIVRGSLQIDSSYDVGVAPALLFQAKVMLRDKRWEEAASMIERVRRNTLMRDDVAGQAAFLEVQAARQMGTPAINDLELLAEAEDKGGVPVGYVEIERGLGHMADGSSGEAADAFDRALATIDSVDSYPMQLRDWVEQLTVMLGE